MAVATRSDEEIRKDVADQLHWNSRVDATRIRVKVTEGVVRLAGAVSTYSACQAAEEAASLVPGVKSVENQLEIEYPSGAEIPADAEIVANLVNCLHWDSDLENADIDVSVNDGWVILRGTVDAYWKKLRAEELASTLTGVQGVSNELAAVPSGTYEDRLIADSIVAALERSVHLDAEFIDVRVNGGVVTLSGSVASLPAFREAQQTAEYTPGVMAVHNDLVIR